MMNRDEENKFKPGRKIPGASELVPQPAVPLHRLSFAVAKDASNMITDCWFTGVGQTARVTSLPTGAQFDIHVKYVATKAYIVSKPGQQPATDWVVDICAVEPTAKIALWDYDVTHFPGTDAVKELILNKNNIWTNPAVVGASNLNFTIYLLGSWDAKLFDNLPTPEELPLMPVQ